MMCEKSVLVSNHWVTRLNLHHKVSELMTVKHWKEDHSYILVLTSMLFKIVFQQSKTNPGVGGVKQ